ncbi:hypothetical protein [Myxosarcina sp. GI1]|uniref:hypothetical protein n=1 Tax=Myxosarcina sp. GI1 TaxID=1541065 RepID=UPI0005632563|nr:hypothetical protein [Myxosarcina sp. GI1]
MSFLVYLVMFGWIPLICYFFTRFPARQAVIIGFILAWLFLPQKEFPLPGLPDYTKMSATCYGILIATVIYDVNRLRSFKFSWVDLPMLVWCCCPLASSVTNGLGLYDGFSEVLMQTVTWGVPYFLGRIYINSLAGLRQLATGIFLGGLVYVPLCLYEIRMSPQLHRLVYGFSPFSFAQTIRYDGYRPSVFMQHGLEVGMWMMAATFIGIWFWKCNVVRQVGRFPISWLVSALLITFILVKSTGAYFLLFSGILVMLVAWQFRTSVTILFFIAFITIYLAQNSLTETYVSDQIVHSLSGIVPEERIESIEFRFNNEEMLTDKAREKLVFGWGGWGRSRIYEYNWENKKVDISITDSLWIIAFGRNGLVGVVSVFLSFFLPAIAFIRRYPAVHWFNPKVAPAAAILTITILYMVDSLFNAMLNPIFIFACGGVAGAAISQSYKSQVKRALNYSKSEQLVHQQKLKIQ